MDSFISRIKKKLGSDTPATQVEAQLFLRDDYVRERILDADFQSLVNLPHSIDSKEWIATHTVGFVEHINLICGAVSDYCKPTTCPALILTVGQLPLQWVDEKGKKYKCSASEYADYVMTFCQQCIVDEVHFPTKYGNAFSSSFDVTLRKIFRLLSHVLTHLYQSHYRHVVALSLHACLNTLTYHFAMFVRSFRLVDDKEMTFLAGLADKLHRGTLEPPPRDDKHHHDDGAMMNATRRDEPIVVASSSVREAPAIPATFPAAGTSGTNRPTVFAPRPAATASGSVNAVASSAAPPVIPPSAPSTVYNPASVAYSTTPGLCSAPNIFATPSANVNTGAPLTNINHNHLPVSHSTTPSSVDPFIFSASSLATSSSIFPAFPPASIPMTSEILKSSPSNNVHTLARSVGDIKLTETQTAGRAVVNEAAHEGNGTTSTTGGWKSSSSRYAVNGNGVHRGDSAGASVLTGAAYLDEHEIF